MVDRPRRLIAKRCQRERWGQLDSNQRRPKSRDLQSLAIAARRYPRGILLAVGLEPTTYRLQGECSTIELCQHQVDNLSQGRIYPQGFFVILKGFGGGAFSASATASPKTRSMRLGPWGIWMAAGWVMSFALKVSGLPPWDFRKQHCLYFLPEPQGQGSLRPIFSFMVKPQSVVYWLAGFMEIPRHLESAVRKALYDYEMLAETKVAVALSGGKDSLTLLKLLKTVSGRGFPPLDLMAIHVGGEFSCGAGVNEAYLAGFCRELEVPFVVRHSEQKWEKLECYTCSRERRRLIFAAAREHGMTTVAFGHHRDDSTQTLLMNLLHKGEFAANLPKLTMHDYGITIIRPLILVSEAIIRDFARQEGFLRVMCQCPVGQNSMRKQTDRLLDEMQALFPNARENLARAGLLYGSNKASIKSIL